MRSRRSLAALILIPLLLLGACSDDGDDAGDGASGATTTVAEETTTTAAPTTTKAPEPLRILVTNDDGIGAEGIDALVNALLELPDVEITVVAPAENQSG